MQAKFGAESDPSTPSDGEGGGMEAEPPARLQQETPVEMFTDTEEQEEKQEVTRVEELVVEDSPEDAHMTEADEVISVVLEEQEGAASLTEPTPETPEKDANTEETTEDHPTAKDAPVLAKDDSEDVNIEEPSTEGAVGGVGARLGVHLLQEQEVTSTPCSPRRFANQGMVSGSQHIPNP